MTFLYRKDIAALLNIPIRSVASNERKWGLETLRQNLNKRVIRYPRLAAEAALRRQGLI